MADAYADFNDAVLGRKRRRMPDEMSGYEPDQEFNAPAPTAAAPPSPTPASPPIPLADSLQADQGDRQPPPRQQRVQATTSTLSAAPTMPPPPPPPPPTPGFDPNASTQSMVSGGGGGFQRAPTSGLPASIDAALAANKVVVVSLYVPGAGVDEDSVTGSAHAALTPFWAAKLGRDSFSAHQASRRGGDLACRLARDSGGARAWLGGQCATVVEGTFYLPG